MIATFRRQFVLKKLFQYVANLYVSHSLHFGSLRVEQWYNIDYIRQYSRYRSIVVVRSDRQDAEDNDLAEDNFRNVVGSCRVVVDYFSAA